MFDFLIYKFYGKKRAGHLPQDAFHDILDLWKLRAVQVSAKGRSITEIYVDVWNRMDRPIKVLISHGTYFVALGSHQNMAVRQETVFKLSPKGNRFINVPATCINAHREIPNKKNSFYGVKKVPEHIERFLKETDGGSPMMVQAGVWSLTDDMTHEQIKERLVTDESTGRRYNSISDTEINEARHVLERLGIQSRL